MAVSARPLARLRERLGRSSRWPTHRIRRRKGSILTKGSDKRISGNPCQVRKYVFTHHAFHLESAAAEQQLSSLRCAWLRTWPGGRGRVVCLVDTFSSAAHHNVGSAVTADTLHDRAWPTLSVRAGGKRGIAADTWNQITDVVSFGIDRQLIGINPGFHVIRPKIGDEQPEISLDDSLQTISIPFVRLSRSAIDALPGRIPTANASSVPCPENAWTT